MAAENTRPCYDRGNGSPFCAPISSDIWEIGTSNEFVWNYNYPFYVTSENISLYLYYKDKYAYQPIKNWTSVHRAAGSLAVQVDNSWFPSGNITTAVLYGYYLPQGVDPAAELANPESQFPRPFNFSVERQYGVDENGRPLSRNGSDRNNSEFPGWAIAVTILLSVGLLCAAFGFLWFVLRGRRRRRNEIGDSNCSNSSSNDDTKSYPTNTMAAATSIMTASYPSLPPPSYPAADASSSIYSTTPMVQQGSPRASDVRSPTTEGPGYPPAAQHQYQQQQYDDQQHQQQQHDDQQHQQQQHDDQQHQHQQNSRLADSTFMWMVEQNQQQQQQQHEQVHTDEDHRRRLGEALLAQQLSQEEGASVKHAERRPITVSTTSNMLRSEESVAVLEELV